MEAVPYTLWNPSGNTTLFFPLERPVAPERVRRALAPDCLDAEQAGFVSAGEKRLEMAGGEFCVNATRSLGAYLAYRGVPSEAEGRLFYTARVSGWPEPVGLSVEGAAPLWTVTAELPLPECPMEPMAGGTLVRLPGISHLLLQGIPAVSDDEVRKTAGEILEANGLKSEPACGVIWWERGVDGLRIRPLVYVRAVDTLYAESSCGSGTMALALALAASGGESLFRIGQPSGESLAVGFGNDGSRRVASVRGTVALVRDGILEIG